MQGKGNKRTKKCKQCKGHPCIHEKPTDEIPKSTEQKLAQKFSIAAQSMDILEQVLIEKEGLPEEILKIASKEELFQLGMDPMCIVAAMGHAVGTRRFVEAGTKLNDKRSLDGSTPLILAAQNKHQDVVEILLKHGADVTVVNNEGNNAFLVAIKTGDAKLVNTMWPYRGNLEINHANSIGFTALHIASDKCWDGCVQFLLANGANIDQQCKKGRTALMLAVAKGDQKVVNRLIDSGADMLIEDKDLIHRIYPNELKIKDTTDTVKKGLTAICTTSKVEKGDVLNIFLEKLEEKNLKDAFVKNRLDRLKQPMPDEDFEDLVSCVLGIIQKLTEMDNYRDVLFRQKLLPSAITIVQKHLKMKDAAIVVALIFATCMLRRDRCLPDERFVQQYIKSRGFEFSMKALKLLSDASKRDYELMITCFFPIICACQSPDGKEWMEKNNSKIAPYTCLREQFNPNDFEFDKTVWMKFWEYYNALQKQTRDRKMAELLEEEERERNRKIKKRERKKIRRHKLTEEKDTEQKPTVADKAEDVKENGTGDNMQNGCIKKTESSSGNVYYDDTLKRPKTQNNEAEYLNIKYENVTENAKTTKSRRANTSKNFLSEFAMSNDSIDSDPYETDNTWTTVQNKKSSSKVDVQTIDSASTNYSIEEKERISPKTKPNASKGDETQRKSGKCWADVAKVKKSPSPRSKEVKPQNEEPGVQQRTNSLADKQQKQNYEDNFPSLNGQQPQNAPSKHSQAEEQSEQHSPGIDYWCPDDWIFRSTSTTPSDFDKESCQFDVPQFEKNNVIPPSIDTSSYWTQEGQQQPTKGAQQSIGYFEYGCSLAPDQNELEAVQFSSGQKSKPQTITGYAEKGSAYSGRHVTQSEQNETRNTHTDQKIKVPINEVLNEYTKTLTKYGIEESDLNGKLMDLCKRQTGNERFEKQRNVNSWRPQETLKSPQSCGLDRMFANNNDHREKTAVGESKYEQKESETSCEDKRQRDWFLVENIDRYLREEENKRSARRTHHKSMTSKTTGKGSVFSAASFDSSSQTNICGESKSAQKPCRTSVAVVKPQEAQQKDTNKVFSPQILNVSGHDDRNCDLGESILRNVTNLQINQDDDVWFPSGLRNNVNKLEQRTNEAVNTFPSFHDDDSATNQRRDLDTSFQQMRELAMYQLQTYYNGMRKKGSINGSLCYHDIPYYASCLGVTEDDLEKSLTAGVTPTIPTVNGSGFGTKLTTSGDQKRNDTETIRQQETDTGGGMLRFNEIKKTNTVEQTRSCNNDKSLCGLHQSSDVFPQSHSTSSELAALMSNVVKPPPAQSNAIQPWIQRSIRWRQKLIEIRNLPASNMKQLGEILIPTSNERFLVPYSDTNAILGFLTDGSEVLVHMLDVTCRSVNTDILRNIISPRTSQYFLIRYRTFAFENGRCFVAMDLPEYTLSEYLSKLKSDRCADPMVVNKLAWQFLKGLSSLHDALGWHHGNMMPSNIFVDVEGKLLLSEYSFVKPDSTKGKFLGLKVIEHDRGCWTPTEVITESEPYSMKSDIQVAGMILHYILSGGNHPYGEINLEIQVSLQQNWPKTTFINDEVNGLINEMLVMPPSSRPVMEQVLKHPYFWANEKRLRFVLIAGSDVLRDMKSGTSTTGGTGGTMIDIINSTGKNSMFSEWTSHVDQLILKEMRSFRQYKNTLVELVLFVYNCCLHFDKLSQTARDIIDEPCKYFLTTFPALFMAVYTAIKTSARVERVCYKPFF